MDDNSLIILGSGSATPNIQRFPSAQVLCFRNHFFLFDCGEGTQIQLRKAKIPFEKINVIFISHLHGDHYFGIFGLLASLNLIGRKTPLTIYAPKGFESIIRFQFRACEENLSFPIKFIELRKDPFVCIAEGKFYTMYSISLSHRVDCWGCYIVEKDRERNIRKDAITKYNLSIEEIKYIKQGSNLNLENGTVIPNEDLTTDPIESFSYAYIADTVFKPEIAEFIKDVKLMYHEATFTDAMKDLAKTTFHSTASQAAECAKMANAQKLIIGHFSARYKTTEEHKKEAQNIFENTEVATDLYSYSLYKKSYKVW